MLLGVDVGGTFTDAVLAVEGGGIHTAKVPSTPEDQSRGVLEAVHAVLRTATLAAAGERTTPRDGERLNPEDVERFAHGMTVATNALLEFSETHPPPRTALIATAGFTDIVELGRQARAHLYRLCERHPAPLAPADLRFGAPERMTPEGPLRPLDPGDARALVEKLARPGGEDIESVAVALLHSYAHPEHELLLGELLAQRLPHAHISLSHQLVGTFREFERAATTEVDAALSPLLGGYLRRLGARADAIGLPPPAIMQSSGGLLDAQGAAAHAALTVLSGPAGGVQGALLLAELAGERNVLCFDMGGTSCDVCLIEDGRVAETATGEVAGRPLALAMLDIHTVGAGGGSIAWRDPGGALRVGPHSAGANPGPACYGRGGELPTVTDANLLLGRLPADTPLAGGLELDLAAAERAVAALAEQLDLVPPRCAEGIVEVAEAEMLRALRTVTVERGIDPRGFALMPFGGAGPLHAAALARALGIGRILCPHASGVLCALGLAAAAPRRDAARTVMLAGDSLTSERLAHERETLLARARADLGTPPARVLVRYELRYRGQSFELTVTEQEGPPHPDALRESFAQVHEQRYGYRDDDLEVQLVTIRASVFGAAPRLSLTNAEQPPATRIEGPTIYPLPESTLYVPPGWNGELDAHRNVRLYDNGAPP
jgi:N-methylhydantoinase A